MSDIEDMDLFAEETPEEKAAAEKLAAEKEAKAKEEAEKKKKKKKVKIAKSMVTFFVKMYEPTDEALNKLHSEIVAKIEQDGLQWNKEHQLIPIGFGLKKLKMGMIIEDEKVGVDDVLERIQDEWEDDVQSTDIDTFDKL